MRNLLNHASIAVSVKDATKHLLSSIKAFVLEERMHFV